MNIAPVLTYIRTHNLVDIATREVIGNNVPHVLIVRNKDEFVDQAIGQFGNSALLFGGGFLLSHGIDKLQKKLYPTLSKSGLQWSRLGKSLGILSFFASIMIAIPQVRNYVTAKRTGTSNYISMIGEMSRKGQSQKELERQEKGYLLKAAKILGIGTAALLGFSLLSHGLIKGKASVPKIANWVQHNIGLPQGKFSKMSDFSEILCGAGAAYAGWFIASRDKYETKELLLKFGALLLAFFIMPRVVQQGVKRVLVGKKLPKLVSKLGGAENLAYLAKFVSSAIFCASIPSFLNIFLTHQRVLRHKQQKQQTITHTSPPKPPPTSHISAHSYSLSQPNRYPIFAPPSYMYRPIPYYPLWNTSPFYSLRPYPSFFQTYPYVSAL